MRTRWLLPLLLVTACSSRPHGYWEGKGVASQTLFHDQYKTLTRKATVDFWFVLHKDGSLAGEADVDYEAELEVANLPHANLGFAEFSPSVGGRITDADPHRRFPIAGQLKDGELSVEIATPEDDRPKLTFTIRADAGVGANSGGPMGAWIAAGKNVGTAFEIPMKPFTPFSTAGEPTTSVQKRPYGPWYADYDSHADTYSVRWTAKRIAEDRPE
jgi:hypothetical protein